MGRNSPRRPTDVAVLVAPHACNSTPARGSSSLRRPAGPPGYRVAGREACLETLDRVDRQLQQLGDVPLGLERARVRVVGRFGLEDTAQPQLAATLVHGLV